MTIDGSSPVPRGGPNKQNHSDVVYDDEISLRLLLRALWHYRRLMLALTGTVVLAVCLWAFSSYVFAPLEHRAGLEFQLIFDGVDAGEYPNGLPFSRGDLIAAPILEEVYDANDLERYFSYYEFKNKVFILEGNRALELLGFEYQGKLSANGLTPVVRNQLEEEYLQKREGLHIAQYSLNFVQAGSLTSLPDVLMSKVLNDILATWAAQAVTRRGVLKYQVGLFTADALRDELATSDDYLVRADVLHGKVRRIVESVGELETLPGASTLAVEGVGKSFTEIRVEMEDLVRYRLEPLIEQLVTNSLVTEQGKSYVSTRHVQISRNRRVAKEREVSLESALRLYRYEQDAPGSRSVAEDRGGALTTDEIGTTTLIPQMGDSFLDRIIGLATESANLLFRQNLTIQMLEAKEETARLIDEQLFLDWLKQLLTVPDSNRRGDRDPELVAVMEARLSRVSAAVVEALDQANTLYTELSTQNLNPRTNLFTITNPFTVTTLRSTSLRKLGLYGLVVFMASLLLVPLACLIHHYFQREILPSRKPDAFQLDEPGSHVDTAVGP